MKLSGLISSLIYIGLGLLLYAFIKGLFIKYVNNNHNKFTKKKQTYLKLIQSMIKYLIIIILVLFVLHINGVNVTSLIAGIGVLSAVAGLALQDALKDVIQGFNLIVDDYYSVGDIIKIDDIEGKIISLGFKTTKIKDINDGRVYVIANRNITSALIMSNCLFIEVPLPYEEKLDKMEKLLTKICKDIEKVDFIESTSYLGVNEFADSSIKYLIELKAKTEDLRKAKRKALGIIKETLDKEKITIPYNQLDIHKK